MEMFGKLARKIERIKGERERNFVSSRWRGIWEKDRGIWGQVRGDFGNFCGTVTLSPHAPEHRDRRDASFRT